MGLFTDHPLLIDISHAPVVILVSDLPPLSAPLLMCGIAKKELHLFLNLQGSFFDPISSSLSRLLFSCKPQKERMNKKDYNTKNVSRNMELLFQTKSKFYDYLLSLVIIPQMSRQFQLLKMKTDLLYFLFFFYEATVMGIVDASPQSTNRSWTCSDVKTWLKNERQVNSTVYIILNPIPKALSDAKYCHSPLGK